MRGRSLAALAACIAASSCSFRKVQAEPATAQSSARDGLPPGRRDEVATVATVATLSEVRDGYSRAAANVPMRLTDPEGPVVGFLRKGALVSTYSIENSVYLRATAKFPRVEANGVFNPSSCCNDSLQVAVAPRIAKRDIPNELATGGALAGDIVYGLYREISAQRSGPGFAFVKCGRVRILERAAGRMRIAARVRRRRTYGLGRRGGTRRERWCVRCAPTRYRTDIAKCCSCRARSSGLRDAREFSCEYGRHMEHDVSRGDSSPTDRERDGSCPGTTLLTSCSGRTIFLMALSA